MKSVSFTNQKAFLVGKCKNHAISKWSFSANIGQKYFGSSAFEGYWSILYFRAIPDHLWALHTPLRAFTWAIDIRIFKNRQHDDACSWMLVKCSQVLVRSKNEKLSSRALKRTISEFFWVSILREPQFQSWMILYNFEHSLMRFSLTDFNYENLQNVKVLTCLSLNERMDFRPHLFVQDNRVISCQSYFSDNRYLRVLFEKLIFCSGNHF